EDVEALQNPEQHVEGDLEDYVNDIDDFTYEHRKFNNNFLLPTLEAINQLIVKCEQLKDEFKLYKETKANRSVDHNIKIHNTLTSDVKTLNGDLRTVEKEMPNLQQRFIDLFPHESHTQHKKT
ncbi:MAG TPA: hypothetical protein VLG38_05785, partial [Gammaproteobacteria bacterium]|nr:hypothetical protein [Gammaproteobacteria bacterium]